MMWFGWKPVLVAAICGTTVCASWAQQERFSGNSNVRHHATTASRTRPTQHTLTPDEGLGVISAALDPKVRGHHGNDCSHMVHAIYEHAGFPYMYATSNDLYEGVQGFRRVRYPQPGDVIVWQGHAGIVVQPSHHVFFSFMSHGPGVAHYDSPYWMDRGTPRFYRYVKNHPCAGCTTANASYRERDE